MPFCPHCRTEYVAGIASCSDCGAALVTELPPLSDQSDLSADDLVPVYQACDRLSAGAVESLLRQEGIDAAIQSRQMPMYDGLALMQNPVWGTVMVLERDAARARGIIEGYLGALPDPEDQADEGRGQ